MANQSKIGIIGGGISGIASAKQLSKHEPVVFEATDSIGGVWKHCSYKSTKLQTPRCDYEFSDFPWTQRDNSSFPSYKEILDYLYSYAKQFDVLKFVRFNSKVVEIRFVGDFEKSGEYGSLLPGKAVWEVGVKTNQSQTIEVFFFFFFFSQASQFLHERPNQGFLRTLICHMLSPMRRTLSKMIESYLTWKLPLNKYGLKPDHPFEEDYASCQMAILPENFFSEADKGKIAFKKAKKWWFWEGGVQFEDGTKLEADVVVLATGFDGKHKLKAIIPDPFRSLMEFHSGMMPLYRGTINPLIPNMAFVGYIESVSNLHTAEIRCKWLSRLVDDQFKLPGVEKMLEQIGKEMDIMRRTTRFYKRSCISTFSINHSDEICEEMALLALTVLSHIFTQTCLQMLDVFIRWTVTRTKCAKI
ncbi:hypothetical protein DH2020_039549 [Rehmannia glutinosa]|uniref:Flavin-containing monooxygenase n=1 Tax=Rehmannia glutinosa TaxID=99300 RepID=A0ABR0UVJ1_REHGL